MLNLTNASTDKLQVVTDAAATLDVVISWTDWLSGSPTPGTTATAITTATTTDVVATPAASTTRNVKHITIRNKHASLPVNVTVVFNRGGTGYELVKYTLYPADTLEFIEGIGFFKVSGTFVNLDNQSTTSQTGFAADTYLAGSFITFPSPPVVGTLYKLEFDVTKTALGTATPIITIRTGTTGTTTDTARNTLTFGAGTAVVDTGIFEVWVIFRSVGTSTSAVTVAQGHVDCLPSTGLVSTNKGVVSVSSGFDSTTASLGIGASYNGGASAAHTIQMVKAEMEM
jgi:hypothetical protein